MTIKIENTAETYDHMMDFVSEENINKGSLNEFLDIKTEYKPEVKQREKDPEFPEQWQHLFVSFRCLEDYSEFMNLLGGKPSPKIKEFIYERPGTKKDIFSFIGDENE